MNRVVQMSDEGVLLEADPRHIERIISEAGVRNEKALAAPGSCGWPKCIPAHAELAQTASSNCAANGELDMP